MIFRSKTKAMQNYIAEADKKLADLSIDPLAQTEIMKAMNEDGYFNGTYLASDVDHVIDERFSDTEKVIDQKNEVRDESVKTEAVPKVVEAKTFSPEEKKALWNQFFDINFRPSMDRETFFLQNAEFKKISGPAIKYGDALPKDVYGVIKAQSKKFSAVGNFLKGKTVENLTATFEKVEQAFVRDNPQYVPTTMEAFENIVLTQDLMSIDLEGTKDDKLVSKPVEPAKSMKKDPVTKQAIN